MSLLATDSAFQMMSVNYTGLALIIAGMVFIAAEAFVTSFGVLGVAGIAGFVVGSMMLVDTHSPDFAMHFLPVIIVLSIAAALFFALVINMAWRARRRKIVSGLPTLIGKKGQIQADEHGRISILLEGEQWQVSAKEPLKAGDTVTVVRNEGLTLIVKVIKGVNNHE